MNWPARHSAVPDERRFGHNSTGEAGVAPRMTNFDPSALESRFRAQLADHIGQVLRDQIAYFVGLNPEL
jgi:hypothetical protein